MKRSSFLKHEHEIDWQEWAPGNRGPFRTRPLGGRRHQTFFHFERNCIIFHSKQLHFQCFGD
jgi:hypothetical protein